MKSKKKRKSGFDQLKPGELPPRPPGRPRVFPTKPQPMPKIVIVESQGQPIGRDENGALYYGEPAERPPDRPRVFPSKPQQMPKLHFIECTGDTIEPVKSPPRRKKPRHGKR